MKLTPARTSGIRWAPLIRLHRFWAISSSLNAMSSPFAREPAPLVTRWRSRTPAKGRAERTFRKVEKVWRAWEQSLPLAEGDDAPRFQAILEGMGLAESR